MTRTLLHAAWMAVAVICTVALAEGLCVAGEGAASLARILSLVF